MGIKHKIVKDYQLLTSDKKIITLKSGNVLEDYKLTSKSDTISLEKEIVHNNPEYFQAVDWRQELLVLLKQNKFPQPSVIAKKMIPFMEEVFFSSKLESNDTKPSKELLEREEEVQLKFEKILKKQKILKEESSLLEEKELELKRKISEIKKKEDYLEKDFDSRKNQVSKQVLSLQKIVMENLPSHLHLPFQELFNQFNKDLKSL